MKMKLNNMSPTRDYSIAQTKSTEAFRNMKTLHHHQQSLQQTHMLLKDKIYTTVLIHQQLKLRQMKSKLLDKPLLVSPRLSVGSESYVLRLSFCLSVILSSWEVTFRSPNLNIACSTATSLSPLIEKVTFYRYFHISIN